ncbi:MAG: EVE domain-containing protein [Vampirovibrionales bacterium]
MPDTTQYWLLKSEPETYSYTHLLEEGEGTWDGVRNHQAKKNLQGMKQGDKALFYHSVSEKAIVGVVEITEEAHPDPTDETEKWVAVKVKPLYPLKNPVSLAHIKACPHLTEIPLIKQSRLSVMPLSETVFHQLLALSES